MGQDLAAANDTIRLLEAEIKILTEKNEVILSEIVSGDEIGTDGPICGVSAPGICCVRNSRLPFAAEAAAGHGCPGKEPWTPEA